jgi:hypothetical protein
MNMQNSRISYTMSGPPRLAGKTEIPVSTDSIQGGRSESLTWSSGGRRLLERVLLEVRDQTASLMLTAWWDGGYADACEGIMDEILLSYRIP